VELEGEVRDGSTVLVWEPGEAARSGPGTYLLTLETGDLVLTAEFVIPE
jgi:hypothetical protein